MVHVSPPEDASQLPLLAINVTPFWVAASLVGAEAAVTCWG